MPEETERIVVSGMGLITALGKGCTAHLAALKLQKSGLRHPKILQTIHAAEFMLGEVQLDDAYMMSFLGIPTEKKGYSRTTLISLYGMADLLDSVDLSWLQKQEKLAFINANTVGGMSTVENLYMEMISDRIDEETDQWIDTVDCAESTEFVARFFGLKPAMATISTACSSSANSIIVGARMLQHGLADVVVAGGGDALSRFTLNGFHSLKNVDREACKPFDQNRNGLNLGEGAGYVLLERESTARARGANILAILSGYSNHNDAYHPTAPSPDGSGAVRTMLGALEHAGLPPESIHYINAHGTATLNNDHAEGLAIQQLWDGNPPAFSSTKPFTGHTLAAAGVVEAILSIVAMNEGMIPPNLNWTTKMEELEVAPSTLPKEQNIDHVMSNSFGFGGNNVSLIFSKA
ncbi:MAG: beta-ketoacyl-[acyl-carrier-protein] synthase family protein [Chitinophagaceae bacterium]